MRANPLKMRLNITCRLAIAACLSAGIVLAHTTTASAQTRPRGECPDGSRLTEAQRLRQLIKYLKDQAAEAQFLIESHSAAGPFSRYLERNSSLAGDEATIYGTSLREFEEIVGVRAASAHIIDNSNPAGGKLQIHNLILTMETLNRSIQRIRRLQAAYENGVANKTQNASNLNIQTDWGGFTEAERLRAPYLDQGDAVELRELIASAKRRGLAGSDAIRDAFKALLAKRVAAAGAASDEFAKAHAAAQRSDAARRANHEAQLREIERLEKQLGGPKANEDEVGDDVSRKSKAAAKSEDKPAPKRAVRKLKPLGKVAAQRKEPDACTATTYIFATEERDPCAPAALPENLNPFPLISTSPAGESIPLCESNKPIWVEIPAEQLGGGPLLPAGLPIVPPPPGDENPPPVLESPKTDKPPAQAPAATPGKPPTEAKPVVTTTTDDGTEKKNKDVDARVKDSDRKSYQGAALKGVLDAPPGAMSIANGQTPDAAAIAAFWERMLGLAQYVEAYELAQYSVGLDNKPPAQPSLSLGAFASTIREQAEASRKNLNPGTAAAQAQGGAKSAAAGSGDLVAMVSNHLRKMATLAGRVAKEAYFVYGAPLNPEGLGLPKPESSIGDPGKAPNVLVRFWRAVEGLSQSLQGVTKAIVNVPLAVAGTAPATPAASSPGTAPQSSPPSTPTPTAAPGTQAPRGRPSEQEIRRLTAGLSRFHDEARQLADAIANGKTGSAELLDDPVGPQFPAGGTTGADGMVLLPGVIDASGIDSAFLVPVPGSRAAPSPDSKNKLVLSTPIGPIELQLPLNGTQTVVGVKSSGSGNFIGRVNALVKEGVEICLRRQFAMAGTDFYHLQFNEADKKKVEDTIAGTTGLDFSEPLACHDAEASKPNKGASKAADKSAPPAAVKIDDPYFSGKGLWGQAFDDQWAIKRVGFTSGPKSAWSIAGNDLKPVTVAVIDSGFDWVHPDFDRAQLWRNPREIPGNGIDDDGNGYVDDVIGWNFVDNNNEPWDQSGHGTIVAGIIAAKRNNGIGIAGINPAARIMVLKALDPFGRGDSAMIAQAITYAAEHGARVINLSLGSSSQSKLVQRAVAYAQSRGALVVIAAGNQGTQVEKRTPGTLNGVITVGATDQNDKHVKFSNFGPKVDIAAPGVAILSLRARGTDALAFIRGVEYTPRRAVTGKDDGYYHAGGTSFAAPIVAGTASLLMAAKPGLDAAAVRRIILNSARDIESPGIDNFTGFGLLDATAALSADPAFYLDSRIDSVAAVKVGNGVAVRVTGTADADNFGDATVLLGKGEAPNQWSRVNVTITKPVKRAPLIDLPAKFFAGSPDWTIRLVAKHKNGKTREARFYLKLG